MNSKLADTRPAEILLADDNDNDVELMRQGLKRSQVPVNLRRAKDGEECLAFLRKEGAYADAPTPDLILLDLNMPKIDGREVLVELASDEALRSLPVVILSTSTRPDEVRKMYALGCRSYVAKPVDFEEFLKVVRSLAEYWFTTVVLPTAASSERAKGRARS